MAQSFEKNNHELAQQMQADFYEGSAQWVESLISRFDPERRLLDVLDHDTERYPHQKVGNAFVPSYQPSLREVREAGGSQVLQNEIISRLTSDSDQVMGDGGFDLFTDSLLASSQHETKQEISLRILAGRLAVPRQNVAMVAYHPNIMALPIYAGAIAAALNRSDFMEGKFDLFKFSKQNLILPNPALSVASFKGIPVMEYLSMFSTQVQTPPGSRNTLGYYDPLLRRELSRASKQSLDSYIKMLHADNKSAVLTIDPTSSTFDTIIENGKISALRRKPIHRAVRAKIMEQFPMAWPMTMALNPHLGSNWRIGTPTTVRRETHFDEMIEQLDRWTEEITGAKIEIAHPERHIGKLATGS